MAQFVKVGSRTEFDDLEGGKLVEAGGHRIAVFNVGGSYYAIENTCPHRGGPLAEGMVVGEEVICPWHGSRFNVKTGSVLTPPARQGVEASLSGWPETMSKSICRPAFHHSEAVTQFLERPWLLGNWPVSKMFHYELRQRIGALAMTKEQPKLVAVGRRFTMGA